MPDISDNRFAVTGWRSGWRPQQSWTVACPGRGRCGGGSAERRTRGGMQAADRHLGPAAPAGFRGSWTFYPRF